jgi:hypothetical protein
MPQFDSLIIFPIIKDLTIILFIYYIIFINIIIKNIILLKLREKTFIFLNYKLPILLMFKSYLK